MENTSRTQKRSHPMRFSRRNLLSGCPPLFLPLFLSLCINNGHPMRRVSQLDLLRYGKVRRHAKRTIGLCKFALLTDRGATRLALFTTPPNSVAPAGLDNASEIRVRTLALCDRFGGVTCRHVIPQATLTFCERETLCNLRNRQTK